MNILIFLKQIFERSIDQLASFFFKNVTSLFKRYESLNEYDN